MFWQRDVPLLGTSFTSVPLPSRAKGASSTGTSGHLGLLRPFAPSFRRCLLVSKGYAETVKGVSFGMASY